MFAEPTAGRSGSSRLNFAVRRTWRERQLVLKPATQLLAELFRSAGYDAIAYKSHFGDDGDSNGYNIAIFDPEAVEIVSCARYQVRWIRILRSSLLR